MSRLEGAVPAEAARRPSCRVAPARLAQHLASARLLPSVPPWPEAPSETGVLSRLASRRQWLEGEVGGPELRGRGRRAQEVRRSRRPAAAACTQQDATPHPGILCSLCVQTELGGICARFQVLRVVVSVSEV